MAFNKAIIMGNLVHDPELHKTQDGKSVCTVTVAVNRRAGTDGKAETDYFDVVNWNKTAEFVAKFFKKGSSILVCGKLQNRSWQDKNGNKRNVTEILADEVTFGEKKVGGAADGVKEEPSVPKYEAPANDGFVTLGKDDDLPF